ncbi:MAG: glycosyltransferase [Steroidobacterales bacterium]
MSRSHAVADPWLTVIMPCYRGEQWIDSALGSIALGSADGIEVLVIDSSPTSAARDIASRYSDKLQLRIMDRPDLLSWHHKTNVGVQLARSRHVCWLHVDDLWFPDRAASISKWIEAAPQASLHLAPSAIIDGNGRSLGVWRCPLPKDQALPSSLVIERLLVQNFIAAPAPVFRRDAWIAAGGLDETLWYTGDWDIWLKLAATGPVYYHDVVTTGFRIHPGSLTVTGSRDVSEFAQQHQTVLDRHLSRAGAHSRRIGRAARASVSINTALAAASAGDFGRLFGATLDVLGLGPMGIHRYVRDSRIMDRLMARIRARFAGAL